MSNYKDRGIMKWAPFDALEGHGALLEQLIYNMAKKEKNELSEDAMIEIDREIKKALEKNKPITIEYYNDGYSFTTFGIIKKINEIEKTIILDTDETIKMDSILGAEVKK